MQLNNYIPTDWVNGTTPAINELHLNKIENALTQNRDQLVLIGDVPGNGFTDKVNNTTQETGTFKVVNLVYISQADYDLLTPVTTTLYVIKG